MAEEKTFSVAGTSVHKGLLTFRFANGKLKGRQWVLEHNQHTEVHLVDLPKPMTKPDAIKQLGKMGFDISKPVLPGVGKSQKTPEQLAAEAEAKKAAEKAAKQKAANEARKAKRAAAKQATVAAVDEGFLKEVTGETEGETEASTTEPAVVEGETQTGTEPEALEDFDISRLDAE